MAAADVDHYAPIEADDTDYGEDYGSIISRDSGTTSITSSVFAYEYMNGRRYHAFRRGRYLLPNDEQEQDRLDQVHHIWLLLFKGESFIAPLKNPQFALDCGTGTGIWASDFGDVFPQCEVTGVDLSPIQPTWVPTNVKFEVDDLEDEWTYPKDHFDFIHSRNLIGSIKNWPQFIQNIYEATSPGGWAEFKEADVSQFRCDDGTLEDTNPIAIYMDSTWRALQKVGQAYKPQRIKDEMRRVGFENIKVEVRKFPMGTWPKDRHLKEVGAWGRNLMQTGLDSYGLGLLTKGLGLDADEANHIINSATAEANRKISAHVYWECYCVYGQKPVNPKSPKSPQSPIKSPRASKSPEPRSSTTRYRSPMPASPPPEATEPAT